MVIRKLGFAVQVDSKVNGADPFRHAHSGMVPTRALIAALAVFDS